MTMFPGSNHTADSNDAPKLWQYIHFIARLMHFEKFREKKMCSACVYILKGARNLYFWARLCNK